MGGANSKIEDDKALVLCRERKRYVKQALNGRCSLAGIHVAYIQALRNTGMALRKLVEPEAPVESSLYTSTSASGTPEALALTDKSASQFSNSSPSMSQNVETVGSYSPIPSSPNSGTFHVNRMKAARNFSTTVEQTPPISATAVLQSSSDAPAKLSSQIYGTSNPDATPPRSGTPPWDYFGLFHPIDNHFSTEEGRTENQVSENIGDIRQHRKEEDVTEFEEGAEKSSIDGESDDFESEDEFDQPTSESLVRIFKNRNEMLDSESTNSSDDKTAKAITVKAKTIGEESTPLNSVNETDGTPQLTPKSTPSMAPPFVNEKSDVKKIGFENKFAAKDFVLTIKDIEELFLKASESGKEVPRMLEANKVSFRPLLPDAYKSKRSTFFSAFLICCGEDAYSNEEPASNETKYLTWHRSLSSLSESSPNPLNTTTRDGIGGLNGNLFSGTCMNSGSHASTLDRLFAWEGKLYDEVKASGIVRKEYDVKRKALRDLESRGESSQKIDKMRANVKDLHSRIKVAIHRIDSISKTIEKLRDDELQPQLDELISGLSRMWETMFQCHQNQLTIISMSNAGGSRNTLQSESKRQAAVVLEYELNSLHSNFMKWIAVQNSYLQSINNWLLKCVFPVKQPTSRRRKVLFSPRRDNAPPIYITCRDWMAGLDNLPTKEVADAIKDLIAETIHFMPRQEKNHGSSNLLFSLPRKDEGGGLSEYMLRNEAPVGRNIPVDGLHCRLEVLLERLKNFSESSVNMYRALRESVDKARSNYEKAERHKHEMKNGHQ